MTAENLVKANLAEYSHNDEIIADILLISGCETVFGKWHTADVMVSVR